MKSKKKNGYEEEEEEEKVEEEEEEEEKKVLYNFNWTIKAPGYLQKPAQTLHCLSNGQKLRLLIRHKLLLL